MREPWPRLPVMPESRLQENREPWALLGGRGACVCFQGEPQGPRVTEVPVLPKISAEESVRG